MSVHPSGYYAWRSEPASPRAKEDQRLLGLIKHAWLESGGVYGYRKITHDLRDLGECCGKHRVYRLMRQEGLRAQVGYRRRAYRYGRPAVVATNRLEQNFDVAAPNHVWVTDITYIITHEGWLYLAVVLDLFSRQVVWLVNEFAHGPGTGNQCLADGRLAAKPHLTGHRAFRSGQSIQQP